MQNILNLHELQIKQCRKHIAQTMILLLNNNEILLEQPRKTFKQ